MGRTGLYVDRPRPEAQLTPLRRIGILGHVGNGNLGDEAIIAAAVQGVRDRIPNAELTAFTSRPDDTRARHGIPAFPIRRGAGSRDKASPRSDSRGPGTTRVGVFEPLLAAIRRLPGFGLLRGALEAIRRLGDAVEEAAFWATRYGRLREIDLLIVAGSNQLSDYFGGPWGFPYSIYAWSVAARLAGTPVAFLSLGAGPIRSPLSRYFIRKALGWSAYHSLRDVGSRDTVRALGVREPNRLAPDLAQGLRIQVPPMPAPPVSRKRTVVVNPLPYFDPRYWAESDQAVYSHYVDLLAAFVGRLLDRGLRVRFAPTQLRADPPVIADVMRALGHRAADNEPADRIDPPVATLDDLIALFAEADVVVATRFHAVILAQMLGKPTIGIAYRRSTTDVLVDVGQGAYAIDIKDLTLAGLMERLDALETDDGAAQRIAVRMTAFRDALAAQYDQVLGTTEGSAGAGSSVG